MTDAAGRPLRILYAGTLPPHQGGSAIVGWLLLDRLGALGHDVEAVAPITEEGLREHGSIPAGGARFAVRRFVLPYLDTSPDSPPSEDYRQLERALLEELLEESIAARRPDVVVIGRESFAEHVVAVARAHGLPSVLLIQGGTTHGIRTGTYPAELAERLLDRIRAADVCVTSAPHMRELLVGMEVEGVEVIPNPVDLERFEPGPGSQSLRTELGLADDDIVVAHLSNLKALKRVPDLIEAAEIALRDEPHLVFVVVGDGPGRDALVEDCAARGLAERFRFTGWVDHDRVTDFLRTADIVVMPSAAEAQALVYLETLACERALLASDIPAAREVVEDGMTGLLFRIGDASDLAAKLGLLARDPGLRVRLGRAGRLAVERHSLPAVAGEYARLLARVAGGAAPAPGDPGEAVPSARRSA